MTHSFSSDEQHRATLAVLQEALDYLRRNHLAKPANQVLARTRDAWSAQAVAAGGVI